MPQDLPDNYIPRYAAGSDIDSIKHKHYNKNNRFNGGKFKNLLIVIVGIILLSIMGPETQRPKLEMKRLYQGITNNEVIYEITLTNNSLKTYFDPTISIKHVAEDGTISQESTVGSEAVLLPFQTLTYNKMMIVTTKGEFQVGYHAVNHSIGS